MAFTAYRNLNPWLQLIMVAAVMLISFLLLTVIATVIAIPLFGITSLMGSLATGDWNDPSIIRLLKYMQVVQSLGLFVLPPFVLGWLFSGHSGHYLQLDRKAVPGAAVLCILAVLVINPFIAYVGTLNQEMSLPDFLGGLESWMKAMEDRSEAVIDRFMAVETMGGLLFNLLMIAVIPAIGEELLFRGVIQKIFISITRNDHWGIWISAALFSALHMQFYGFVPRMLLGALFGYMLVFSRTIWLPILCHFINNALGVIFLYLENQESQQAAQLSAIGERYSGMWTIALLSLMLTIALLVRLQKKTAVPGGEGFPAG